MVGQDRKIVVGIGELLWDCFSDRRLPGGAPANVAFHSAQLGMQGFVCSRVGDDDLGRELRGYLQEQRLDTEFVQVDSGHPTGTVTVDTSDVHHPNYTIHENVAWDHIAFTSELEDLMGRASAVCFGTLAQRDPVSRETIHRALAAAGNALVVYDVNLRQSWYDRDWIERSMHASRIVKLNGDEVGALAKVLGMDSFAPKAFAEDLRRRYGVEIVCVTRAADGCLVLAPDETVDVPGIKVDVVDAVGAGDAFTAATIATVLEGWPLRTAVTFANQVGALVASKAGAMPVLGEELDALWSKYGGKGRP